MRGDRVVARTYDGTPVIRRVWDASPRAIFLVPEAEYQELEKGRPLGIIAGFPPEDVFSLEGRDANAVGTTELDWKSLRRWTGR